MHVSKRHALLTWQPEAAADAAERARWRVEMVSCRRAACGSTGAAVQSDPRAPQLGKSACSILHASSRTTTVLHTGDTGYLQDGDTLVLVAARNDHALVVVDGEAPVTR